MSSINWSIVLSLLLLSTPLYGQPPEGNPEDRFFQMLKPWGVMKGSDLLDDSLTCLGTFGAEVYPLGKVDGVPWWVVSVRRCESRFPLNEQPQRLLLYRGVAGGFPAARSGERIGQLPDSQSQGMRTWGDWDANGYPDLAVVVDKFNDTSDSNVHGYSRAFLCIYWGSQNGYLADDTTHLPIGGFTLSISIWEGVSYDFTGDGVADLAITGGKGLRNSRPVPTAQFHVFAGHRGKRWGRDGVDRRASFEWWNPPAFKSFNMVEMIDQDCDGRKDLVFVRGDVPGTTVAIIYGTDTPGIDTNAVESAFYAPAERAIYSDMTGDGVPELCMNLGYEFRIYAGRPGQRIVEQLGTGNDPPDPGHGRPYARPWVMTAMPSQINFTWNNAHSEPLYSFDVNGDGLNDLATISNPFFIVYTSGLLFSDSLIDAEIDMRSAGGVMTVVPMGDIDGSGVPTVGIGVSKGSGSLWLMKPNPDVAVAGDYHEPPHKEGFRCEHAAGVRSLPTTAPTQTLQLSVQPNPSSTEMLLNWQNRKGQSSVVVISDLAGKELQRIVIAQGAREYRWNTVGWSAGEYILTVQCSGQTGSALVRVR